MGILGIEKPFDPYPPSITPGTNEYLDIIYVYISYSAGKKFTIERGQKGRSFSVHWGSSFGLTLTGVLCYNKGRRNIGNSIMKKDEDFYVAIKIERSAIIGHTLFKLLETLDQEFEVAKKLARMELRKLKEKQC